MTGSADMVGDGAGVDLTGVGPTEDGAAEWPVMAEVDMVIVGGSTAAVHCAVACARRSLSVVLLSRYTYLGEDLFSSQRYLLGVHPDAGEFLPALEGAGPGTWPRPMLVKTALEDELLEAGIPFLYGCYPGEVLRSKTGGLAGITVVSRSGKQVIRARAVIDATERALLARHSGLPFEPYPSGRREFERLVIGGEPGDGDAADIVSVTSGLST